MSGPVRKVGLRAVAVAAAVMLTATACGSSSSSVAPNETPAPGNSGGAGSSAPLFSSLPANIQSAGKIVIGSSIDYPPFEYYDTDGVTLMGFEVELANALEKQLGVPFSWQNASFDTLFSGLQAGRYDLVYGATNDTADREKLFDFADYLVSSQAFVVAKGNPDNITVLEDICGKSIAAVRGGVQPQFLEAYSATCKENGKAAVNVLTFDGNSGEQLAVREGKASALLENFPTAVAFAQASEGALELVPNLQVAKRYFGMVIPKESTQLRDTMLKAWQAIIDDGTYQQVLTKWNLADLGLKEAVLNGTTTKPMAD